MDNHTQSRSLFATRLRQQRKKSGMTQMEVAKELNIHRSTYAYYETDKTKPDHETLLNIARLFSVSVDFLLGRDVLRNDPWPAMPGESAISEKLTAEEWNFLNAYRQLDNIQKIHLKEFISKQLYKPLPLRNEEEEE